MAKVASKCSTPFGITEVLTRNIRSVFNSNPLCSTPFGITEVLTSHRRVPAALADGAQRLSASQRFSHHTSLEGGFWLECSTPFGITEVLTGVRCGARCCPRCAQRLSASQRFSPTCECRSRNGSRGAQRLSASQRFSLGCADLRPSRENVLNAFRHHRGSHTCCFNPALSRTACSTPLGITEVLTEPRCNSIRITLSEVPPVAVPLPMLDPEPSVVPGVGAS